MKITGLTLEEIAITHKDNELVKGLVKALVDARNIILSIEDSNPTIDFCSPGAFKYIESLEKARKFLGKYEN